MTKFVFNPRTGMMDMKKEDQIYFGGSQGGGLRIDDHKHNVKFIINKDESITNLFGVSGSNVALYDMKDARTIAMRVMKKFGREHKYSDYRMFLQEYVKKESYVKSFDEFVNEGLLGDIVHRDLTGKVKKENGTSLGVVDGKRLILPPDVNGDLIEFDGNKYYYFDQLDIYFAVVANGDEDIYYVFDPEKGQTKVNMYEWFSANVEMRANDFGWLRALIDVSNAKTSDLDGLETEFYCNDNNRHRFAFASGEEYAAYDNSNDAEKDAIEDAYNYFISNGIDEKSLKKYRDYFGDSFIDMNEITEILKDDYENYYNELDNDEKITELLRYKVIEDNDLSFETDESGDVDHTKPTFDPEDYSDEYAEARLKSMSDTDRVDEYFDNFGYDDISSVVDYKVLAEKTIESDGPATFLAYYDGEEYDRNFNGNTYLFYRLN